MENAKAVEILEKVKHNMPEVNEAFKIGSNHIKKWDYFKTTVANWSMAECGQEYRDCLHHISDLIKEIDAQYK